MADSKTAADATSTAGTSTATASAPTYTLRVIQPFGDYIRGDAITDAAEVTAVLAGENAPHVVKIAAAS